MPETPNGLPYPPGTGVLPDVPYWLQQLAEATDTAVFGEGDPVFLTDLPAGSVGNGTARLRGSLVVVELSISSAGIGVGSNPVATVPEGYRPTHNVPTPAYLSGYSGLAMIYTSGAVTVFNQTGGIRNACQLFAFYPPA